MAQKILQRVNGQTVQYEPVTTSAGAADAGEIVALGTDGKIHPSMYDAGGGVSPVVAEATEALAAGRFVNLFNNGGTIGARLADNSNARPAHGFVLAGVSSGVDADVYPLDSVNTELATLTVGAAYYLGETGQVTATPLDAADVANVGKVDQKLGLALSATELSTDDYDYVIL